MNTDKNSKAAALPHCRKNITISRHLFVAFLTFTSHSNCVNSEDPFSLLVMAVLGGAILPPLQGKIADLHGLQISYIVPLIAYAYVGFYGAIGHRIGRPRQIPATA